MSKPDLIEQARRYFDLAPEDAPTDRMLEITKKLTSGDEREWARGMDECLRLMSRYAPDRYPRVCLCCGRAPA